MCFDPSFYPNSNLQPNEELVDVCKYSFNDLILESKFPISTKDLYSMSNEEKNMCVKRMCIMASWYWKDVVGKTNDNKPVIYTSFSPNKK